MIPKSGDEKAEVSALPAWKTSVQEVYPLFGTQPSGLSESQARENLIGFGKNALMKTRKKSVIIRFLVNFTHLVAILLWVGGFVAFLHRCCN
jgi:P-type Ca2+ transporter type 2C